MKYYVIHGGNEDRRKNMERQLTGKDDVEWITMYPPEDMEPLCKISTIDKQLLSGSMKHYEAYNRMVVNGIMEAVIFEDDVIISELYDEDDIFDYPYVNLGSEPPNSTYNYPLSNECYHSLNNGGAEASYVQLSFARKYIENITLRLAIDHEICNFVRFNGYKLFRQPVCHQNHNKTTRIFKEDKSLNDVINDLNTNYPEKYTYEYLKSLLTCTSQ